MSDLPDADEEAAAAAAAASDEEAIGAPIIISFHSFSLYFAELFVTVLAVNVRFYRTFIGYNIMLVLIWLSFSLYL